MKTPRTLFLAIVICNVLFITSGVKGQCYPVGGTVGAPIKFCGEMDCLHTDPGYTIFWDFGPDATPQTATTPYIFDGVISASYSVEVTYSTLGDKTVTATTVSPGGSSVGTTVLHIFDCSNPSIPHNAIVIKSDTTITVGAQEPAKTYWVNSGVVFNLSGGGYDTIFTIFAEPGSTISGAPPYSVLYMKHGSVLTSSSILKSMVLGDGASINDSSLNFTLHCPTLDFDYTNAPPNPAHQLAGVVNASLPSITISPNPTRGIISIQGAPSNDLNISVLNILGETMMQLKNPHTSDFTLDLSKLIPGTYYIRFSSANSVVTKMVVRE